MPSNPKYYIIEAAALPDVFLKVAEAKRLLSTGEVSTVNSILPFHNMMIGRIITFQLTLHDEPGVLSSILACFAKWEANILTINQTMPTHSCALGTITAETARMHISLEELLSDLSSTAGVVKADVLAG